MGVMTCVTGVSGSGKSSLVNEILYKTSGEEAEPGQNRFRESIKKSKVMEQLDKVINIDQSPIGRTPQIQPGNLYRRV